MKTLMTVWSYTALAANIGVEKSITYELQGGLCDLIRRSDPFQQPSEIWPGLNAGYIIGLYLRNNWMMPRLPNVALPHAK